MVNVFCPRCAGRVVAIELPVTTFLEHPIYGARVEMKVGHAAVCVGCSLISELSRDGHLIDLGSRLRDVYLTLSDLDAPMVPGIDKPPVYAQAGSTLLWHRRDS